MAKVLKPEGLCGAAVREITCESMLSLGRAAAQALGKSCAHPPVFYISRDTRTGADVLEAALSAGICIGGGVAHCLGVLPSSAMALLIEEEGAECGISLSGGMLPPPQIVVRFFAKSGLPMNAEQLDSIAALLPASQADPKKQIGRIERPQDAARRYLQRIASLLNVKTPLYQYEQEKPLRIAVDCANGAVTPYAELLLRMLGTEPVMLSDMPDGQNICRECGVNAMEALVSTVKRTGCDAGFAFDGDGTRCLAVDGHGESVHGDRLLALLCADRVERQAENKTLPIEATMQQGCAVTEATNLGFLRYARENGIPVHTAQPEPQFILERMRNLHLGLGGDSGGRIYFCDLPAADGLMTMARVIRTMQRTRRPLSELASVMEHDPQVSVSVRIPSYWCEIWKNDPEITAYIAKCQQELGMEGRLVVRERRGDAAIRIMLEGRDFRRINKYAFDVADVIQARIAETL